MDAFTLIACSGPGAMQAIAGSELYAQILVMISAGIVAFSLLASWLRPPSLRGAFIMVALLAVHPGFWASARHGDCGDWLRESATVWTICIALAGVVLIASSRRRSWSQLNH